MARLGPLVRHVIRWVVMVAVSGASIVLAAWLILQWGILPRAERWKPHIEQWASTALGAAVRIEHIDVAGSLWAPMVTLQQVRVARAAGQDDLQLREVRAVLVPSSLVPRSLTHWEPRFEQLWIDAPSLQVRRHRDGHWSVAGIDLGVPGSRPDDGRGADWLFAQRELAIRGGTLTWSDETGTTDPLTLTDVTIVLRNSFARHRWRIDATPPPGVARPVLLMGDFRQSLLAAAGLQRPGDWRQWRGQLYLHAPLVDAAALARHVTWPAGLPQGLLAAQGWVDVERGELTGVSARLLGRDVSLPPQEAAAPLTLTRLDTRIDVTRRPSGTFRRHEQVRVDVRDLRFDTADGINWPGSTTSVEWERDAAGTVRGGSVESSALDLATLARLGAHVPLPAAWRGMIEEMRPRGRLLHARARWQGPPTAPTSYWAAAQADKVSLDGAQAPAVLDRHARPRRPGVRMADADFELTERGGRAVLSMADGAIELPGVFEEPLVPFTRLAGELRWRIDAAAARRSGDSAPHVQVEWRDVTFANDDLRGQAQGRWNTGTRHADDAAAAGGRRLPGYLELDAQIDAAQAARVHRYLPVALPETTRHYLRDALRSGRVEDVAARVRGPLLGFPYAPPASGEFTLTGRVRGADFAYVPDPLHPWPAFSRVDTEVEFDRQRLRLHRGRAAVDGLGDAPFQLDEIEGRIDDLAHEPRLVIEGRGRGAALTALQYVRTSPVGGFIGHALDATTATGAVDLGLALDIPLGDVARTTVNGSVVLAGNNVQFRPDVPLLADARARVDFNTGGFNVTGATARVLGGTLAFEGGQREGADIRFTGQGLATADGLRRAVEWPVLARLGTQLAGQARYQLQLGFVHGQPDVLVTSTLNGLAARLPAPLGKSEGQDLPMRFAMQPLATSPSGPPAISPPEPHREWLRLEVGSILSAQYLLETPAGSPTRVLRGNIALGAPTDVTSAGPAAAGVPVVATIALPQVSVDAWRDWWDRNATALGMAAAGPAPATGTGTTAGGAGAPGASPTEEASRYVPGAFHLRTPLLVAGSERLTGVDARVLQDATGRNAPAWRADIDADQIAGRIDVRLADATMRAGSLVTARLSRLALSQDNPPRDAAPTAQRPGQDRTRLPDLDVEVDDLRWRGKRLGRLEVRAAQRGDGSSAERPREWRIAHLALLSPEARLTATGNWTGMAAGAAPSALAAVGAERTALTFTLDLQDAGAWFGRLGWGGTVRNGTGQIQGTLAWPGSPLAFALASLSGQAHIGVDRGQFLRAEPGVARLLGVLSLQSLTRRLMLDFDDVFGDGFAFDRMDGDVDLRQGVARTGNLRIRGVQAAILAEGSTDLGAETQDLHIWVVPDVNAGAASLLYAAINPAIGIGTLIGQLFLRKTIAEATTREFHVSGRWDAPQVAQMSGPERRPLPSPLSAPPAAPSSSASSTPPASGATSLAPGAAAPETAASAAAGAASAP